MHIENRNTTTKKEMVRFIRMLHKRFMKLDFLLYTEFPKEPTKFYTNKITKEHYKRILFKYKNKVEINYNLNKSEYKTWRANFPMQNLTIKDGEK